ncbi:glycosyltransferase [Priestia aryabhattai]|uniref:glycosyltransferase n=1 Tax=Priestia aryabhattai TaxID=412384 RepID=UPI003D2A06BE
MIHYFTDVVVDEEIIRERNFKHSEAGYRRSMFVVASFAEDYKVVSMASPEKKGYFKSEQSSVNEKFLYLAGFKFSPLFNAIVYNFIVLMYLLKNCKKKDKIIVYNLIPKQIIGIYIYKLLFNNDLILQIEELYSSKKGSKIKKICHCLLEKLLFKVSNKIVAVNSTILNKYKVSGLISYGYPSTMSAEVLAAEKSDKENAYLLYSGRLDEDSGIINLIEAFIKSHTLSELWITGNGPLKPVILEASLLDSRIKYLGFLEEREYNRILKNSQACINTIETQSEFSKYSFPSKVLTYMSFHKPIITSYFNALEDLPENMKGHLKVYKDDSISELVDLLNRFDSHTGVPYVDYKINEFFTEQSLKLRKFIA